TVVKTNGVTRVAPQGAKICQSAATIPDEGMIFLRVCQRSQDKADASNDDQLHRFHSLFSFCCSRVKPVFVFGVTPGTTGNPSRSSQIFSGLPPATFT